MGTGSKVVVTGDVTQIDLPDKARSGLVDALQVLKTVQGIAMMFFSEKDIVRHRLVQEIIRLRIKRRPSGTSGAEHRLPAADTGNMKRKECEHHVA